MDDDLKLVERLTDPGDHKRLCQGREYVCSCGWDAEVEAMLSEAGTTITRLHAEIEALKSDVSDLVRAGSDEATENERLVKERDEALRSSAYWFERHCDDTAALDDAAATITRLRDEIAALEQARDINQDEWAKLVQAQIDRAETAEAQRDAALEALRPFEAIADHFDGLSIVEVCTPHPENPSPRIMPVVTSIFGRARAASRTLEGE